MSIENTFRALKGEPLLSNFRCNIGLHRWTNWTQLSRPKANSGGIYPEQQTRYCARCNKHEIRILGN